MILAIMWYTLINFPANESVKTTGTTFWILPQVLIPQQMNQVPQTYFGKGRHGLIYDLIYAPIFGPFSEPLLK